MDDAEFADLIALARRGDESATVTLLRAFEPEVRMMVRVRLPRALRSQFDSLDFVQAVWKSFFTDLRDGGAAADDGRFDNPRHLGGFLAGIVRNKVHEEHRRRTQTRKYDLNREERLYVRRGGRDVPMDVISAEPDPALEAQARDRFDQLVAGRSSTEVAAVALRGEGRTFGEIEASTGIGERSVRRLLETIRLRMEARSWE